MSRVVGISGNSVSDAEMLRMRLISESHKDGVSPTQFLELLDATLKARAWQELDISFMDLVEAKPPTGMGIALEDFKKLIDLKHRYEGKDTETRKRMKKVRSEAIDLLSPMLAQHGGDRRSEEGKQDNNVRLKDCGNSETYTLRRLKRDAPELAEKVMEKELSANAAAIKAGFRPRTATFYPDDIRRTARALRKHFDPEELYDAMVAKRTQTKE